MRDSQKFVLFTRLFHHSALILLMLMFGLSNTLYAADDGTSHARNYDFGIEYFQWEEFNASGNRLLSEHGPRFFLSFTSQDLLSTRDKVFATLQARFYAGNVDYDGQTQVTIGGALVPSLSGIYLPSTSRYTGFNLEALSGWDVFPTHPGTSLLVALGTDVWKRDIANGIDARGNSVSGIQEDYKVIYSRLGLNFEKSHQHWTCITRIGFKRPLWTDEQVAGLNLTLEPGKQWSFFASYQLGVKTESDKEYFIKAYYDSYRFSASPVVNNFLQPESQLDTFGVSLGSTF